MGSTNGPRSRSGADSGRTRSERGVERPDESDKVLAPLMF